MRFTTAAVSHAGGRENNEDFLDWCSEPGGESCWIVADGLGGHYGGEVASQTAVQGCIDSFKAQPGPLGAAALQRHLQAGQDAVLARRRREPLLDSMRTTVVALLSDGVSACWGHVGDSRLYCVRDGRVAAKTKDHSVPQAMADAGDISPAQIRHHEDRNRLLRDVGGDKGIRPALLETLWPLRDGDAFLLCTDGFWEYVTETAIEADLAKAADPAQWLANMASRIHRNIADGHDNYSAIAVFVSAA